jgi:preprotein translocase subunit YajC
LTPIPFALLAQATAPSAAGTAAPTTTHTATMTAAPGSPTTNAVAPKEPPFFLRPEFLPIIAVVLFFVFMSRSKKKQEKKAQDLRNNLKRGDRVQTIGGILGTVVEARDTEVLVKVDETSNTKIRFSRNAIHRVIVEETAAADKK